MNWNKKNDSGVAIESTPLLACPFCGGGGRLRKSRWPTEYAVECERCRTMPGYFYVRTSEEAVELWNTRHANAEASASEAWRGKLEAIVGTFYYRGNMSEKEFILAVVLAEWPHTFDQLTDKNMAELIAAASRIYRLVEQQLSHPNQNEA